MLTHHGYAPLLEVPLNNGRRVDIMGLSAKSEIVIVETKSGIEDFAVDQKWPEYIEYCDAFYFGVDERFPLEIIPSTCGIIVADAYGGEFLREPERHALAPARRKALLINFARLAALRLQNVK